MPNKKNSTICLHYYPVVVDKVAKHVIFIVLMGGLLPNCLSFRLASFKAFLTGICLVLIIVTVLSSSFTYYVQ